MLDTLVHLRRSDHVDPLESFRPLPALALTRVRGAVRAADLLDDERFVGLVGQTGSESTVSRASRFRSPASLVNVMDLALRLR